MSHIEPEAPMSAAERESFEFFAPLLRQVAMRGNQPMTRQSVLRGDNEPIFDYVMRWCFELRKREVLLQGSVEPDMSRHAMLLSPAEYSEFMDDRRSMLCFGPEFKPRACGVRIVQDW